MYFRNSLFGPMTSDPPRRSRSRCAYRRNATRCRPTAVFPVPGAPWTQTLVAMSARTISSCSGWMVETMSRIGPERGRSISWVRIRLAGAAAVASAAPCAAPPAAPDGAAGADADSGSSS